MNLTIMRPHLICIGGLPSSGKTTLAHSLPQVGACIIDPHRAWLTILGKDPDNDLLHDEDLDREKAPQVIKLMLNQTQSALAQSKTVIVPSAFIIEEMRQQFETLSGKYNANFTGLWLDASLETRRKRSNQRLQTHKSNENKNLPRDFNASAIAAGQLDQEQEGTLKWQIINAEQNQEDIIRIACSIIQNNTSTVHKNEPQ